LLGDARRRRYIGHLSALPSASVRRMEAMGGPMMDDSEPFDAGHVGAQPTRSAEQLETIAARRRTMFWRRAVATLLGLSFVLGIVFWQRSRTLTRQCRLALAAYAQAARQQQFAARPTALIEADWASFNTVNNQPPSHYHVIARNWSVAPDAEQSVPLAVCATPHGFLVGAGHHVLFNTSNGLVVRWVAEEEERTYLDDGE